MKIVHVGGFSLRAKGAFQHGVAPKLSNGMIRNGHSVANVSDRDLARSLAPLGHRKFGVGRANRFIRDFCRNVGPDLLVLGHADVVQAETVALIRTDLPGLRVAQWNVDPLFEPDNVERLKGKLAVVDATLVSTAGDALRPLRRAGMALGFLPNPVDFSIEAGRNHERSSLPFELFYGCGGGHLSRRVGDRVVSPDLLIDEITAALPGIRLLLAGFHGAPHLSGSRYQAALESAAIGLNLSRRNDADLYSSDRLAQLAGNGQAVLIDRATGYDRLFGDDEMAFFEDTESLIAQLDRLRGDHAHRQKIGAAGRERYHMLFNERIVAGYLVDAAFGRVDPARYPWPSLLAI